MKTLLMMALLLPFSAYSAANHRHINQNLDDLEASGTVLDELSDSDIQAEEEEEAPEDRAAREERERKEFQAKEKKYQSQRRINRSFLP